MLNSSFTVFTTELNKKWHSHRNIYLTFMHYEADLRVLPIPGGLTGVVLFGKHDWVVQVSLEAIINSHKHLTYVTMFKSDTYCWCRRYSLGFTGICMKTFAGPYTYLISILCHLVHTIYCFSALLNCQLLNLYILLHSICFVLKIFS